MSELLVLVLVGEQRLGLVTVCQHVTSGGNRICLASRADSSLLVGCDELVKVVDCKDLINLPISTGCEAPPHHHLPRNKRYSMALRCASFGIKGNWARSTLLASIDYSISAFASKPRALSTSSCLQNIGPGSYTSDFPVEEIERYRPGGYHPVRLGDVFSNGRYRTIHKLG